MSGVGVAEDGIRDLYVTGVQTCALPISRRERAVPLDFLVVQAFDSYEFERMGVPAAASGDFVLSRHPDNTYCPEPGVIRTLSPEAALEQAFFAGEVRIIFWL